jgi:uncharacterized membrane protein
MTMKSLDEMKEDAARLLEHLRQERDELNVRMHLAQAEVREEWHKLEPKWAHFEARAKDVAASAGAASKDVGSALGLLGEELRHGYARIREALKRG